MLEIGSLIDGKYKILNKVAQGGMSVVYMAINERANKTWAVKEIRKDGVLNFEAVKQGLVAEVNILKKLSHPNLPSIIDVIDTDDCFIIIMDYVQGNSLEKVLEEYGAQPQEYVIKWGKQLCDVLGYLHSRKPPIIYRDMKPANIMLKPDGNIALIDFGTAREFKEKNLADTTCLGTIGYAAPEQFGGMGQTDARTDVYCLGATLYHLVTGCNPSKPPYEIKPIRQINPTLSSGLEQIILKCTQRDPNYRYQSVAELMYAFEHYYELDDRYKKKQKKKFGFFMLTAVLSLVFVISGFVFDKLAVKNTSDTYNDTIYEADLAADYDSRVALYEKCIGLPNSVDKTDAYIKLMNTYKENDSAFTREEANQLTSIIKNNKDELQQSKKYSDICFEVGKLYWYYYDYGDSSNNQITRAKSSIEWFQEAIKYAPNGYSNLNQAKAYSSIGIFYRDIAMDINEANENGKFAELFNNLSEVLETIAKNENESEIVRLDLLELSQGAIQEYATKFKSDDITKEDLLSMYNTISDTVKQINVTADKTKEKRDNILSNLESTKSKIELAFATGGGES